MVLYARTLGASATVLGVIAGTAGETMAAFGWQRAMALIAGSALIVQAAGG